MSVKMRGCFLGLLMVTWCAAMMCSAEEKEKAGSAKGSKALERTRKTVRMLDDIYKTTVVLITDKYVHDEDDFPAGGAAKALFSAISAKGWHEVKLLDVSGEPYNEENVAQDEFEKEAAVQIKSGKAYFERVERRDGERYLRAATTLPVVLDKCVMCHENYKEAKEGEAIGMLSYTLKIE